jgi:hypothetical protein
MEKETVNLALSCGYSIKEKLEMALSKHSFHKQGNQYKYEPVLVFNHS